MASSKAASPKTSRRATKPRSKSSAPQPKSDGIADDTAPLRAAAGGIDKPVDTRPWSETHGGTLADDQPASASNLRVCRVPSGLHSSTAVAVVIRGLESLSETLPAVLQVANGVAPQWIRYTNTSRDTLISAIDMLTTYRNHRESREMESDDRMITEALDAAKQEGIALGIEQEKRRVKEARHGRGRK